MPSKPYSVPPSRDQVIANNTPFRNPSVCFPSGLSSSVPAFEFTAIQSPSGDHSGTQFNTVPSSGHNISPGSLPPTRTFITPTGGPCDVKAIQFPSGDQVGAHCAALRSASGTGTPPVAGAIHISVVSRLFGLLRLWRTNAIRSPSGE